MNRSEYHDKLKASLQAMDTRITDLESKVAKVNGKSAFQRLLDEVKSKRDTVRAKLQSAGSATDSAWSELKGGLDRAWSELETSYDRARSQFASSPQQ